MKIVYNNTEYFYMDDNYIKYFEYLKLIKGPIKDKEAYDAIKYIYENPLEFLNLDSTTRKYYRDYLGYLYRDYPEEYYDIYEREKNYRYLKNYDKLIDITNMSFDLNNKFDNYNILASNNEKYKNYNPKIYNIVFKNLMSILESDIEYLSLAGGAAYGYVKKNYTPSRNNDMDFFFHSCDKDIALRILKKINNSIYNSHSKINENCYTTFLKLNATDHNYGSNIKLQFILRIYNSPAEIIHGFDVDCCCVLLDIINKNIYTTERGFYSLKNNINVINFDRLSPSYEYRLIKYLERNVSLYIPYKDTFLKYLNLDFMGINRPIKGSSIINISMLNNIFENNYRPFYKPDYCEHENSSRLYMKSNFYKYENNKEEYNRNKSNIIKLKQINRKKIKNVNEYDQNVFLKDIDFENIKFKTIDPSDQIIGTFQRLILKDDLLWYKRTNNNKFIYPTEFELKSCIELEKYNENLYITNYKYFFSKSLNHNIKSYSDCICLSLYKKSIKYNETYLYNFLKYYKGQIVISGDYALSSFINEKVSGATLDFYFYKTDNIEYLKNEIITSFLRYISYKKYNTDIESKKIFTNIKDNFIYVYYDNSKNEFDYYGNLCLPYLKINTKSYDSYEKILNEQKFDFCRIILTQNQNEFITNDIGKYSILNKIHFTNYANINNIQKFKFYFKLGFRFIYDTTKIPNKYEHKNHFIKKKNIYDFTNCNADHTINIKKLVKKYDNL